MRRHRRGPDQLARFVSRFFSPARPAPLHPSGACAPILAFRHRSKAWQSDRSTIAKLPSLPVLHPTALAIKRIGPRFAARVRRCWATKDAIAGPETVDFQPVRSGKPTNVMPTSDAETQSAIAGSCWQRRATPEHLALTQTTNAEAGTAGDLAMLHSGIARLESRAAACTCTAAHTGLARPMRRALCRS